VSAPGAPAPHRYDRSPRISAAGNSLRTGGVERSIAVGVMGIGDTEAGRDSAGRVVTVSGLIICNVEQVVAHRDLVVHRALDLTARRHEELCTGGTDGLVEDVDSGSRAPAADKDAVVLLDELDGAGIGLGEKADQPHDDACHHGDGEHGGSADPDAFPGGGRRRRCRRMR
jgi:hypothetical protein